MHHQQAPNPYTETIPSVSPVPHRTYAPGRGQSGAYWGTEKPELTAVDAYGNQLPKDAKLMAALAHLSAILSVLVTAGILPFLGPIFFWLIYRDRPEYAFVTVNARNASNFSISLWLINITGIILSITTVGRLSFVALTLLAIISLTLTAFHLFATLKSYRGEVYTYPLGKKFIR